MRKTPRQARSHDTVEVIIEAAARILGRRGWGQFTTNEVADVAGVSIGSLYQYFPNKVALAAAIRRRHFDDLLAAIHAAHGNEEDLSLEKRVERLVLGIITAHAIAPALHRVLLEEVPRDAMLNDDFETEYLRRYEALIVPDDDTEGSTQTHMRAQVLSAAVEGVVHGAVRKGALESPALARELIDLAHAYLRDRQRSRRS